MTDHLQKIFLVPQGSTNGFGQTKIREQMIENYLFIWG
jgi:hypothetical protein